MAYYTEVRQSDSNCAQYLMGVLDSAFIDTGWTRVTNNYNPSGTNIINVYRSNASANGGIDYFVSVWRTSNGDTGVRFSLSELYNPETYYMRKYVPAKVASNAVPDQSDFTVVDAVGKRPQEAAVGDSAGYMWYTAITISTSGYTYWLSINQKRLIICTRVGSSHYFVHAGMADNMIPTSFHPSASVALCLCSARNYCSPSGGPGHSSNMSGFTREPGQSAYHSANFATYLGGGNDGTFPNVGSSSGASVYTDGRHIACRAALVASRDPTKFPRALLSSDIVILDGATNAVGGDTTTINNKTYVCFSNKLFVDSTV